MFIDETKIRVKAGDDSAFDFLVQKYRRPIVNFMYRMAHNAAEARFCIFTRELALAAHSQHTLIRGDFNRFGVHTGKVHVQNELNRFLVDIDGRQPGAGICGRRQRRTEQTIDFFLEPADECPGLITYDGH